MPYNIWNKWDKLNTVMLGECYSPEFFQDIKSPNVKSALQRIASETQEDLENYERVLKDFGCKVLRPKIDCNDSIMAHVNNDGKLLSIPRSPLQPRDQQMVVGNELFYTGSDHLGIATALSEYDSQDKPVFANMALRQADFNNYKGDDAPDWPSYEEYLHCFTKDLQFSNNLAVCNEIKEEQRKINSLNASKRNFFPVDAPSITVVGKDVYVDVEITDPDCLEYPFLLTHYLNHLQNLFPSFQFNFLTIGGHSDGCFHTIKPGAILSLNEIQTYDNTFPGWDVCYLPDQSFDKVEKFIKLKKQNKGKWWVPGEEDNNEFTHFVETWLQDWVGYVEETVFDVNVLVLDEHHVCVSQPDNKIVNTFLKKHNMEPVYVPWRHRYFWDGGLHCITLDLVRKGTQQDYFPQRTAPITDTGYSL